MKPTKPRIKLEKTDPLKYGKYKGLTVKELCVHRPEYVLWLYESGKYDIDTKVLEEASTNLSPLHVLTEEDKENI